MMARIGFLFDLVFGLFFQVLAWLHAGACCIAAFAWFQGSPWMFTEWKQLVYFPLMGIVSQVVAFYSFRNIGIEREIRRTVDRIVKEERIEA